MYYDWVKVTQEFEHQLPLVSERAYQNINVETSELGAIIQPRFKHKGSYSSVINIQISGNRLTVDGNPSKYNRLDNLVGYSSIDQTMHVYNDILRTLGLPEFTKCKQVYYRQQSGQLTAFSDGAYFQRIDVCSNHATGNGNQTDYLRGISTLRYRNSIPRLHTNGRGCDWLSPRGNARLIYPKVYDKAHELRFHALRKMQRTYGKQSEEAMYIAKLADYLEQQGVVRFEQEFHREYLERKGLRFWGLFDESEFRTEHEKFIKLDESLKVSTMEFETISETLINEGICNSTVSANSTSNYAFKWMHGYNFAADANKSSVKTARARLRKIGIDIFNPYNQSQFSPITVKKAREITVSNLVLPDWYKRPVVHLHAA